MEMAKKKMGIGLNKFGLTTSLIKSFESIWVPNLLVNPSQLMGLLQPSQVASKSMAQWTFGCLCCFGTLLT